MRFTEKTAKCGQCNGKGHYENSNKSKCGRCNGTGEQPFVKAPDWRTVDRPEPKAKITK